MVQISSTRKRAPWNAVRLTLALVLGSIWACLGLDTSPAQADEWVIECVDCPRVFSDMTDRSLRLDAGGHPHIAYGKLQLYHARYDGSEWHTEVVDDSPSVGPYASLFLVEPTPGLVYAHISYYDAENGALKYAYQDAGGWHRETVDADGGYGSLAVDSNGVPHIGYRNEAGALKYARKDADAWETDTLNSQDQAYDPSLALDSAGYVHISYVNYQDPNFNDLKRAYQDAGGWHTEVVSDGGAWRYTSLVVDGSGYAHISYSKAASRSQMYAYQDAGGWHFDTVDDYPTTDAWYNSLALNPAGVAHISYFNNIYSQLKHAYQDGSGWEIEYPGSSGQYNSLALADDGTVHVSCYSRSSGQADRLVHKTRDGSEWQTETVETAGAAGRYTSIVLDDQGNPHISYRDDQADALKYAEKDEGGWHVEIASTEGNPGFYTSLALDSQGRPHVSHGNMYGSYPSTNNTLQYSYRTAGVWVNQTVVWGGLQPDYGRWTSLALDGSDQPHITCDDNGAGILKYAYRDGSGWHVESIDLEPGIITGHYWYSSLGLDASGNPRVSYRDIDDYTLKFAYRAGPGDWRKTTVDSPGSTGAYTSLALDTSGYAHISYYDTKTDSLKYAYRNADGWHKELVDATGDVGCYTSLALDRFGRPHISYYDRDNTALKVAYRDVGGWHHETVDDAGDVGQYTSLALDLEGQVYISYHDATSGHLKCAHRPAMPGPSFDHVIYLPLVVKD